MDFLERVASCADALRSSLEEKPDVRVRLVGSLSADGITACTLLSSYLRSRTIPFTLNFVRSITDTLLAELHECEEQIIAFLDLGVGKLKHISSLHPTKTLFIFDHHVPHAEEHTPGTYLNPHLEGLDGTTEISTAGVMYFLLKALGCAHQRYAVLALVGAVGDAQERGEFLGLNKQLVRECGDYLQTVTGITLFGAYTKPLVKVLERSLNPFLPGVTGNQDAVIRFLERNGISVLHGRRQKWLHQLSPLEVDRLLEALAPRVPSGKEGMIGPVYLIKDPIEGTLYDLREYSALLNACAPSGRGAVGFGVCAGDERCFSLARSISENYHRSLLNALVWFFHHKGTEKIVEKEGYVIINAEGYISDQFLGTVLSLISRSGVYPEGTILVALAYTLGGDLHVSSRFCGKGKAVDLKELLDRAISFVGGEVGGHSLAAGAHVKADKEEELLRALDNVFSEVLSTVKIPPS